MRKQKRRKRAIRIIEDLYDNPIDVLFIHYSSEDIYIVTAGKTPRITSIVIRFLNTGMAKSFSMHITAEIKQISIEDIEKNYDCIEKSMLEEYFLFVEKQKNCKWVHWKMRDVNCGFEAIENRFRVLGGSPVSIDDGNKFQLSELLKDIYSSKYIDKPRFYKLMEKNKINKKHLLDGEAEAKCFKNKEHIKIHKSILSKTEALINIFIHSAENTLKTKPVFWARYGNSIQGFFEWTKENWGGAMIVTLIIIGLKELISKLFQ